MNQLYYLHHIRYITRIFFIFSLLLPIQVFSQGKVQHSSGLISSIDLKKGELVLLRKLYTFKSNVKIIIGKQLFPTMRNLTARVNIHIRYIIINGENRISSIEVIPI